MKKIAVIGCGKVSHKHFQAISNLEKKKKIKLVAVCDSDKKKMNSLNLPKSVKKYNLINKLIKKENFDIISILTPSGYHYKNFIECAGRVKTIIIEKPVALKMLDAKKMISISKKKKINLYVVLQNRFNPAVILSRKIIKKGIIGKVFLTTVRLRWSRDNKYFNQAKWRGTWKYDGGVIANQCSHHIDLLQWLSGMPKSIIASTIKAHDSKNKVEDTAISILKYKDKKKLGLIEATIATRPKDLEGSISILGTKGSIVLDGFNASKIKTFKSSNITKSQEKNILKKIELINSKQVNGHLNFYSYIIDNNKFIKNIINNYEGISSLKIINAVYKSSLTSREVFLNENLNSKLGFN